MFTKLILLFVITTCASAKFHDKFQKHLNKYGKRYDSFPEEVRLRREQNYLRNAEFIEKHNKDPKNTYQLGSNEFSDRDHTRFVEETCRTQIPATARALPAAPAIYASTTPARATVDYTASCLSIVNQGGCGSCWAFSVVAVIECYNKIRGRAIVPLSQQNLVDCDTYDGGCGGGWPTNAFNYLRNIYGNKLAKSTDYTYINGAYPTIKQACKNVPTYSPLNYNSYFQFNLNGNEAALKQIISNYGPVAIAMTVSNSGAFQNYKSGIFYDPTCPVSTATYNQCNAVNHAMVAVGYGKNSLNQEYFIVRNSWGTSWGQAGYIWMAMGRNNNCNVACFAMGIE